MGYGDGVVEAVGEVSDCVCRKLVSEKEEGEVEGEGNCHVRWSFLNRCRLFQIAVGRTM